MLTWLSLLPLVICLTARLGWSALGAVIVTAVAVAETGRRVGGGARVFPATATLLAPVWLLERGLSAWLAVAARVFLGGIPYHGRVLTRAATPMHVLAGRLAAGRTPEPARDGSSTRL